MEWWKIWRIDASWKFTGFYGHPDVEKRHEAWALLRHLASLFPYPWICIGDFNEIVENADKWGGRTRSNSQMGAFRQALDDCGLTDLGYRGPKFTWCNFQTEENFIKERLDRGVANLAWRNLFPEAEIQVEVTTWSDHTCLLLSLAAARGKVESVKLFVMRRNGIWTKVIMK
jgi:endonuclease/exonuclease/phosphatase family metal-dependent hydrolase